MKKFKYKSGKPIPENVMDALKYTGKVGVITRPTWKALFGSGNERWIRRQLLNLEGYEVLKRHSCNHQLDTWVLTERSKDLLRTNGFSCVSPVPPHLIEHDEVVGRGLWRLKNQGECQKWASERELKSLKASAFIIEKNDTDTKYPDAIFKVEHNDKITIAVEYERTGKSSLRYRSILKQYASLSGIGRILYICEDDAIRKRIQNALDYVGDRSLMTKVGFIKSTEWIADPIKVHIESQKKSSHLKDFLKYM